MNDPHSWYPFSAFKFFLIIFRIHFTKELSAIIMIKNELGGRPVRLKVNWCQKSAKALCRKHYGVHLFCQRDTRKPRATTVLGFLFCLFTGGQVFHSAANHTGRSKSGEHINGTEENVPVASVPGFWHLPFFMHHGRTDEAERSPRRRVTMATSGRLNRRKVFPELPSPRVTKRQEPFFS